MRSFIVRILFNTIYIKIHASLCTFVHFFVLFYLVLRI